MYIIKTALFRFSPEKCVYMGHTFQNYRISINFYSFLNYND